jgi:[protein-PII] uridylyltransferase
LERLRADLNRTIRGELTIDELIEKHRTRQPKRARPRAIYPARVIFDNDSSRRYTVMEIRAPDRPGLLYRITRALNECRLDIHRAIITTEAYGVVDVFFVTDLEFNKIHIENDQNKIRKALLDAIDAD